MNEKRNITRDPIFIENIIKGYYIKLSVNKFKNLDKIGELIKNKIKN